MPLPFREMSPTRKLEQLGQDLRTVALARGFNALLAIAKNLTHQERELQSRLRFAHNEVGGILWAVALFAFFNTLHDERIMISSRSGAATAAVTD